MESTMELAKDSTMKYAVVSWFNYRKELSAGFIKGFDDLEKAKEYAFNLAKSDVEYEDEDEGVITEDDITDNNGPGKSGSPYSNKTIIGYGGGNKSGYCMRFYCVVEWFDGVKNHWCCFDNKEYWQEKYDTEWYPYYSY